MEIREATDRDFDQVWPIFHRIVAAGDTYAYPPDTNEDQARQLWMQDPRKTFVLLDRERVLGTYYIKTNQAGPGAHVCNCGYMVEPAARRRGLATAMCRHSQEVALSLGYLAMQFNFVAASNEGAVKLWISLGFTVVGRLPNAFNHPLHGYVDALVMYKWLATANE